MNCSRTVEHPRGYASYRVNTLFSTSAFPLVTVMQWICKNLIIKMQMFEQKRRYLT